MGPSKSQNAADRRRMLHMQDLGCIVFRIFFPERLARFGPHPGHIHHVLYGGRRHDDEHQHTICWMPWYHVGEPPQGRIGGKVRQLTIEEATRFHGPSWCLDKAAFERRFATEGELLEMQNQLLKQYAQALAA